MSEERKKLSGVWPWIGAVLIGLPVLYVVSFGPACWLCDRHIVQSEWVGRLYQPLVRFAVAVNAQDAILWYGELLPGSPTTGLWHYSKARTMVLSQEQP